MKVQQIEVKNLKSVSAAQVKANGGHVLLVGKNGTGKTTVGNLVASVFTGQRPSVPLKTGETDGYAEITLTDGQVVRWEFDEKKDKLILIAPNGHKSTQGVSALLKSLAGGMSFDINEFLALPPKKQADAMKKLLGVDFSEIDRMEAETYARRTEANRELKGCEARRQSYDIELVTKAPIDSSALMRELRELESKNAAYADAARKLSEKHRKIEETKAEIARLQGILATDEAAYRSDYAAYSAMEVVAEDTIAKIRTEIASASDVNAKIEAAKLAHRFEVEYLSAKTEAENAELAVQTVRAEKEAILQNNPLPAKGMTFGDEGLMLDGLPFEDNQISTSRKMIAGAEIALSQMAQVRVLHFDVSLLDDDNIEKLKAWANDNDLQLFMEMVARGPGADKLQIEITEQ